MDLLHGVRSDTIETARWRTHFPPIDAQERWSATFFAFLDSAG